MGQIIPMTERQLPEDCYVFKHSTTCPVSARAADEVRGGHVRHPLYWINVIEQRPLSNWVAETYGVRHESPQLLKIENGRVVDHWSHGAITRDLLER